MKRVRLGGGIAGFAGLLALVEASGFHVRFLTDPVGPRGLPVLAGVLVLAAGIALAARPGQPAPSGHPEPDGTGGEGGAPGAAEPATPGEKGEVGGRGAWIRVGVLAGALLAYSALLPPLGFTLSTTGVLWLTGSLFGGRPLRALLTGCGLSVGLWLLFVEALGIALPVGWLWRVGG